MALARANVAAAQARLDEAKRDLDDTHIKAPYEGRVLRKNVDIGQVVGPGTLMAEVYAVDYAEIRLPLTLEAYAMIDVPSVFRGGPNVAFEIPVRLTADFGPRRVIWEGKIVRVEGALDSRSRQINVVAQVSDPYGPVHQEALKVGLFVDALIEGRELSNVYRLPRTALREEKYILTVEPDNTIRRVEVDPVWTTADEIIFATSTVKPGTTVSLTQVGMGN